MLASHWLLPDLGKEVTSMRKVFIVGLFCFGVLNSSNAQSILGFPSLSQVDSTTFELTFKTDSAAIISVHAAQDSTFRSAFIFLGRTIGKKNEAQIKMDRLRNNTDYQYRIFLGTKMSQLGGTFTTGNPSKK